MDHSKRYVGTNYHPHDWEPEQWVKDLDRMQAADFNVIRTTHICWDSLEPREGAFTFQWLDQIMDMCQAREIKVFLDIPGRSAPLWLHKKHPSIDITDASGNPLHSNTRYMEDVGDSQFQKYALRLAETMVNRYKDHPALLAFGLENELGAGFHFFETYKTLYHKNIDGSFLDLRQVDKNYPIVIVPGHALMSKECADAIRSMVEQGTTVMMTGYSAKVDEKIKCLHRRCPDISVMFSALRFGGLIGTLPMCPRSTRADM